MHSTESKVWTLLVRMTISLPQRSSAIPMRQVSHASSPYAMGWGFGLQATMANSTAVAGMRRAALLVNVIMLRLLSCRFVLLGTL